MYMLGKGKCLQDQFRVKIQSSPWEPAPRIEGAPPPTDSREWRP